MTPISPVVYVLIAVLGLWAVMQYLLLGKKPAPTKVRPPLIGLIALLVVENLYYGTGRLFPDIYDDLGWWWPVVLSVKLGYVFTLAALNVRLNEAH